MAKDLGCSVKSLMQDAALRGGIRLETYTNDKVGLPTLRDIMSELEKPGRDPRKQFEAFSFMEGVNSMEDLNPGMRLPGIVTNVTAFGAFVDIGVHQDGLVHISQLADRFVKDPNEVVKVHQHVMVTVMEVNIPEAYFLSMKSGPRARRKREWDRPGQELSLDDLGKRWLIALKMNTIPVTTDTYQHRDRMVYGGFYQNGVIRWELIFHCAASREVSRAGELATCGSPAAVIPSAARAFRSLSMRRCTRPFVA